MKRGKYEIRWKYREDNSRYWWWVYMAANGEIVCTSQTLKSEAAAHVGIKSVRRGVFNPVVVCDAPSN